jgi:glycosyltransferase involved in cell wall biosynthesis
MGKTIRKQAWHIGVTIPARNEEQLLARCLTSVLSAIDAVEPKASVDVVVIADSSTDQTYEIAQKIISGKGTVARTSAGAAGAARRIAAQLALERYHGPLSKCWLANTDADCIVPRSWLLNQLILADSGIQALAGTISVDSFAEHEPWVKDRFAESYVIDTDGSHPHIHGANMGFRADCYLKAGGWSTIQTSEDHDLWGRLQLAGAKRYSTSILQVITSGRRVGRAPNGFAQALAAHN